MVSPLSIYHILSLTTNGALNNTLNEMLKALNEKDLKSMNSVNIKLNSDIQKLTTVELANAVFTKFKPEAAFIKMINQYKAEINTLESVDQVNQWCNEKTHNKIPKILHSLTPNDLMVLINAIYFKGKWVKSFDKSKTRKNNFLNFNKTPIEVFFMNATDDYMYFENKEVQALSINYKNDNLEALILLPKHQIDINNYISNLTSQKYQIIISKLSKNKVILSTGPFDNHTHWEQTIFYIEDDVKVKKGQKLYGNIAVIKDKKNFRFINIKISYHFPENGKVVVQQYKIT
jgi:serpin B